MTPQAFIEGISDLLASFVNPVKFAKKIQFMRGVKNRKGTPYKLGGNSPEETDCGELIQFELKKATGIQVKRTITEQVAAAPYRREVWGLTRKQLHRLLKPGDCIAFDSDHSGRYEHGVIYIGKGKVIHATGGAACPDMPSSRCKVVEDSLNHWSSGWRTIYSWFRV